MKKTILIVTPYLEEKGGVEIVTKILVNCLVHSGFNVELLTADVDFKINFIQKFLSWFFGLPYITHIKYKKLDASKYYAVICNGEHSFGIRHEKQFTYFHGSYFGLKKFNSNLSFKNIMALTIRAWIQRVGAVSTNVVSVSYFLKGILENQKIKVNAVINNPVDFKLFHPINSGEREGCAFFGRYDYYGKGIDYLEQLAKSGLKIDCFTDNKHYDGILNIYPMISHSQLCKEMNKYKVIIHPSRFESFGMSVAEAMSCGIPVLVGKTGVGLEIVNSIPEFVVEDFSNLFEVNLKLDHILKNYSLYSSKSLEYAQLNFSLEKFKDEWLKVLNA